MRLVLFCIALALLVVIAFQAARAAALDAVSRRETPPAVLLGASL